MKRNTQRWILCSSLTPTSSSGRDMEPLTPPLHFLDNLVALKVLGKGAMGDVFLVYDRLADPSARNPFALKVVEKSSMHAKLDADRRARWEIQVLTCLSHPNTHPFLPFLIGSSESDAFLAWAVPYCSGGDLNVLQYRQSDRVFSPAAIRFYLAEIVCAIEHLHGMGIAYRDLKPENVLIQQSGHVTLTDFDLSRKLTPKSIHTAIYEETLPDMHLKRRRSLTRWMPNTSKIKNGPTKANSARVSPVIRRKLSFADGERSNSFVGTEEYVAPEVVHGDGHEFAVDWWALGILAYEMLYGTTPFKGKDRKETFRNVLFKGPEFIGKRTALTDLIERLLEKNPKKRLGYRRGGSEIKEHEFFSGVRWDLLTEVVRPPFIPSSGSGDTMEQAKSGGVTIREYFESLHSPPSLPPSPLSSPSSQHHRDLTLVEF